MLVLSRREGERIRIGESITVTVVRCAGDKVRIGIEAPPDMLILRGELELYDKREGREGKDSKKTESSSRQAAPVDYNTVGVSTTPTPIF